jgi:uncharacterized protein (DUF433 family)
MNHVIDRSKKMVNLNVLYQKYMEIKAEKRFGQPCIVNTRITVFDILSCLASGMTFKDIIEDFPELSEDHIKAALSLPQNENMYLELRRDTFIRSEHLI